METVFIEDYMAPGHVYELAKLKKEYSSRATVMKLIG